MTNKQCIFIKLACDYCGINSLVLARKQTGTQNIRICLLLIEILRSVDIFIFILLSDIYSS